MKTTYTASLQSPACWSSSMHKAAENDLQTAARFERRQRSEEFVGRTHWMQTQGRKVQY